jgi:hypothetical protein
LAQAGQPFSTATPPAGKAEPLSATAGREFRAADSGYRNFAQDLATSGIFGIANFLPDLTETDF